MHALLCVGVSRKHLKKVSVCCENPAGTEILISLSLAIMYTFQHFIMSNIHLIIEERAASIGKFLVGRLLPFREKRMVGPFIYIDHMGPVKLSERENFDILPHPHIGLSTLTFLFEGSILHRDTLGNAVEIKPGAVNWMTAGKWIVHSERTPEYLRHADKYMHGLQIWVALPKELEQMEPEFFHIDAAQIPTWTVADLQFKLVAGEAFGHRSAVPVYSKLFMIEIKSSSRQSVNIGHECAGFPLDGSQNVSGCYQHFAKPGQSGLVPAG